jgi:transketolase
LDDRDPMQTDIAVVGKKVVEFYKKKGGEVISPLVKAF